MRDTGYKEGSFFAQTCRATCGPTVFVQEQLATMSIPSDFPPPIQEIGIIQMNDPKSPFIYDAVNSKKADPQGIRNGEFIVQNAAIAESLKTLRKQLNEKLPHIDILVTHFENWGTTISNLLLYIKPKSREEVRNVIEAAAQLNIKVFC